ncbi:MAG: hypothetical protein AB8G15_00125 [Saprospiraceae bacterium]
MRSMILFVALSWLISIQQIDAQPPNITNTQALFTQVYPELEPHQLFFITKPSLYELKTEKLLLVDTLSTCLILTHEQQRYEAPCRYFILEDQIEVFAPQRRRILQANQILAVKMDDKVFIPKTYHFRSEIFYGYFQVLVEGKYNLYKKYTTDKKKEALLQEYFYQRKQDQFPISFSPKKKRVAQCFVEEGSRWSAYYRKTKPSFKKETDLIAVFQYFSNSVAE